MVSIKRAASSLVRMMLRGRERRRLARDRSVLADSGLFDPDWYRATYPEVAAAGWDPVDHYLAVGATGRTSPGPNFDAAAYLAANPDVAADGSNPLLHYIEHGRRERRPLVRQEPVAEDAERRWVATRDAIAASGLFDPAWYLARHPELRDTGWDPLDHVTTFGAEQRTSPGPAFDTEAYLEAHPEVAASGIHPILHFLKSRDGAAAEPDLGASGFGKRLIASGLFDPDWYAQRYFGAALAPGEALGQYLRGAHLDAHAPGPYFEPQAYLKANPDVAGTGLSAIEHYLLHGLAEGRRPNPYLDPAWYAQAYPDVVETGLHPLAHFVRQGDAAGRQPGPDFRPAVYLENHPTARGSSLPPLADFLTHHWGGGRIDLLKEPGLTASQEPVGFTVIVRLSPAGNLGATLESLAHQGRASIEVILTHEPGDGVDLAVAQAHVWRMKPWSGSGGIIARPARRFHEAVRSARQSFVVVVDAGDLVMNGSLPALTDHIVSSGCDIAYGDEEYPGAEGAGTVLKPGWSPELLGSYNYFGRLTALRRSLLPEIDEGAGAASEWALSLAASRATDRVEHLPRVLCWRADPGRLDHLQPARAPEDFTRVLADHWRRQGVEAEIRLNQDGTLVATWELKEKPLVSVIIPNRDKPDLIRTVVDGLSHRTAYPAIEILVVDNGSTDPATLAFYAEAADRLRIVRYDESFNYSRACNLGAAEAQGELLLFLNNDIEIQCAGWLDELVRRALRPGVGVVGAKLLYPDGAIQHAGVAIGLMGLAAHVFHRGPQHRHGVFGSPDVLRNWSAVTGACQLVRRSLFDLVGGYDEAFQLAYSDITLCLDIVRAGYRVVYTPYAPLIHHESATRGQDTPHRDQILFARRVRAAGFAIDPLFHPRLDRASNEPRLHGPDSRSAAARWHAVLERFAGPALDRGVIDPCDDGAVATAAGVDWTTLSLVSPGKPEPTVRWGARVVLWFLRRRLDLRQRFPDALHAGAGGAFAAWLREDGLRLLDADPALADWIDSAFAAQLGSRPRRMLAHNLVAVRTNPLILLPNGGVAACRLLFDAAAAGSLEVEEILWSLLEVAERPHDGLALTWALSPAWQQAVPDGGTVFGWRRLVHWVSEHYGITQDWLFAQSSPKLFPNADQVRLTYRANLDLARFFPAALHDAGSAAALIRHLGRRADCRSASARMWCAAQDPMALGESVAQPGINVLGELSGFSSTRTSVTGLLESLRQAGLSISIRDVPRGAGEGEFPASAHLGAEVFGITLLHLSPDATGDSVTDIYARAGLNETGPVRYRIAYWASVLEPPAIWDRAALDCDEVWTLTELIADRLRTRYNLPVKTLFPGLEVARFQRHGRDYFGIPENCFVFTFLFDMRSGIERKNPAGLIRAFRSAFAGQDDTRLVIKVTSDARHRDELVRLKAMGDASVILVDAVYSRDETLSLIDVSDAYVSLHRSEGAGLTMMEAMLLGRPVVATHHCGHVDWMTEDNCLLVDCSPVIVDREFPPDPRRPVWKEPCLAHAAAQMRRLYDDSSFARTLGQKGQIDLQDRFSFAQCGRAIAQRLNEIRRSH